ncbi:hypothetical protein Tsubulata_014990 [Turnera subulata]|uniref:Uncharacterized protein n=1 Tax=Turnera subulata TaxID=218843 RepID=A0A9Q0F5X5_9ROSI|nr:hypothetical protein Tsubulata_014990 [Turnera subulata]
MAREGKLEAARCMTLEVVVDHVQEPPFDIWALECIVFTMITRKVAWDLKPDVTTGKLLKTIDHPFVLLSLVDDEDEFNSSNFSEDPSFTS